MRHSILALSLLSLALLAAAPRAGAVASGLTDTSDVFNQLQRNAWYLDTADHKDITTFSVQEHVHELAMLHSQPTHLADHRIHNRPKHDACT